MSHELQSELHFTRWLKDQDLDQYTLQLQDLEIRTLGRLLQFEQRQLIEIAGQLGIQSIYIVYFVDAITSHPEYKQKSSINHNGEMALMYRLAHLLRRLQSMGLSDNWDIATDDIYTLIDESEKQRQLITHVEDLLKINKNNFAAWDMHGLLNARRGFLADARRSFKKALIENPDYLHARFNNARLLHYELGDMQTAKTEYERIVQCTPNFSRAYNSYAKLLEKMNQVEKAEKYFRHAIKLRPKSVSYRHYLAKILSQQNRPPLQVQQVYQEAVQHHPRSATLRFHHALSLVKCRFDKEAEMEFKNALKLNPRSAQIYHEYGKFCERHRNPRDYKKATDLYFKAFQLDPVNFLTAAVDAANLMRRLDTQASRASAEQLFRKLTGEAPHLSGAFLGYTKLLVREDRWGEAEEVLRNGLLNNPKQESLRKYHEELVKVKGRSQTYSGAELNLQNMGGGGRGGLANRTGHSSSFGGGADHRKQSQSTGLAIPSTLIPATDYQSSTTPRTPLHDKSHSESVVGSAPNAAFDIDIQQLSKHFVNTMPQSQHLQTQSQRTSMAGGGLYYNNRSAANRNSFLVGNRESLLPTDVVSPLVITSNRVSGFGGAISAGSGALPPVVEMDHRESKSVSHGGAMVDGPPLTSNIDEQMRRSQSQSQPPPNETESGVPEMEGGIYESDPGMTLMGDPHTYNNSASLQRRTSNPNVAKMPPTLKGMGKRNSAQFVDPLATHEQRKRNSHLIATGDISALHQLINLPGVVDGDNPSQPTDDATDADDKKEDGCFVM